LLALGCDPNPNGPTAVPPAAAAQSKEPLKVKVDDPLIHRD
jgi:hypothetical protein